MEWSEADVVNELLVLAEHLLSCTMWSDLINDNGDDCGSDGGGLCCPVCKDIGCVALKLRRARDLIKAAGIESPGLEEI